MTISFIHISIQPINCSVVTLKKIKKHSYCYTMVSSWLLYEISRCLCFKKETSFLRRRLQKMDCGTMLWHTLHAAKHGKFREQQPHLAVEQIEHLHAIFAKELGVDASDMRRGCNWLQLSTYQMLSVDKGKSGSCNKLCLHIAGWWWAFNTCFFNTFCVGGNWSGCLRPCINRSNLSSLTDVTVDCCLYRWQTISSHGLNVSSSNLSPRSNSKWLICWKAFQAFFSLYH